MPYVMVPVPDEHVEEVMQFILREVARANQRDWDAESVSALFHEVDEVSRSLLAYAARSTLAGDDLSEREAADLIQMSQREVSGILRELNELSRAQDRPSIIGARTASETLPNGRTSEKRMLWMSSDLAPLISEAERAEFAEAPQPLEGSA